MKIKPIIEGTCVIVPAAPVLDKLSDAGGTRLKVLLYILANTEFQTAKACDDLNITEKSFNNAIEYWIKAGAILCEGYEKKSSQKKTAAKTAEENKAEKQDNVTVRSAKTLQKASSLPRYSTEEVARYIEENSVSDLIAACQQCMGKMFNVVEIETVVAMLDYLKLSPEYIMLLFAHCEKVNKRSVRYVEKLAIGLFDDGILGYEELDEHLRVIEAAASYEKQLRKLFGIGKRALLEKEKKAFENWIGKWNMSLDLIERAYQVTVENTGSASVPYCNGVLENWHSSGFKTVEDAEAAMTEYRHDKEGIKDKKGSFDTGDFFDLALRRSFLEENE